MIGNQAVAIRRFKIAGKDESLLIEGAYSPDPTQRLTANFKNFNLSHADIFLNSYGIQIGGLLSGFVHLQNENNKPLVQAEVGIENLAINRQDMGFMEISSQWNSQAKALSIKAKSTVTSEQIQNHPIDLSGYYYPSDTNQNFDIVLKTENFNLKPLQPFLKMAIAELDGFLSSEIQLKGSTKNPQIQGKLSLFEQEFGPNFSVLPIRFRMKLRLSLQNHFRSDDKSMILWKYCNLRWKYYA
jgi:autotransporter translocation and assembly factor TamB